MASFVRKSSARCAGGRPARHAPAHALLSSLALLSSPAVLAACGPDVVEARALWVDEVGSGAERRLHVYDRGVLDELTVLGERSPIERVRIGPDGRGVLLRVGDRRGAWIDLEDHRRLPLLLPAELIAGASTVQFTAAGTALWWRDEDGPEPGLALVPLAPGLALARRDDGSVMPLLAAGGVDWALGAASAPIVLVAGDGATRATFLRYPTRPDESPQLIVAAEAEGLALPAVLDERRSCGSLADCRTRVALDGAGERALFSANVLGPWQEIDRRRPQEAGPLPLPPALAAAELDASLGLLHVVDREVSIWQGSGQLHRWDRRRAGAADEVASFPIFAAPPYWWFPVVAGEALLLLSTTGPVFWADAEGVAPLNLETTTCTQPGAPVVSPAGAWVAWTCADLDSAAPAGAGSGVVVRVSSAGGLERLAGVPMTALAIDDDGDLLLHSVQTSFSDVVDGIESQNLPRSLFVLSGDGVLTRIDDLEPAPIPVFAGDGELATFMQAVALGPDHGSAL